MNKTVDKHLENLISFYSKTDIKDSEYLKRLFVRNLRDVLNRYNKYVIPELIDNKDSIGKLIKEVLEQQHRIDKAINYIKKHSNCSGYFEDGKMIIDNIESICGGYELLEILGDKENENIYEKDI